MTNSNRIYFRIAVGDWSNDGHGKCDYFTASSTLSLKDVRKAYFKAVKNLPEIICPENFLSDYDESKISEEIAEAIKKEGFPLKEEGFHTKEMAEYVVWFINKGNPVCDVKLELDIDDTLHFYGEDENGQHIGFFGYGLLGD